MPSASIHLSREQWEYVQEIAETRGLDNPSQALKKIVDHHQGCVDV